MKLIGFFQLTGYTDRGIEGGHRILHNQANLFSVDGTPLPVQQGEQFPPMK